GVADCDEGIIRGGLAIGLPSTDFLACRQRSEDCVVNVEDCRRSDASSKTEHHATAAVLKDIAHRVLLPAVMAGIIAAHGDRWKPEHLGTLQRGPCNPNPFG